MNPAHSDPAFQRSLALRSVSLAPTGGEGRGEGARNLHQSGTTPPPSEGRGNLRRRTACLVSALRMLALVALCSSFQALHAADPLTETFQKGLFEEEANRNVEAAIEAYESVVKGIDSQRHLAATAVFRLGECYRKLNKTNEAVAQFQRVVREFSGEDVLVKLSRQNLTGLGFGLKDSANRASGPDYNLQEEAVLLKRWRQLFGSTPSSDMKTLIGVVKNDPRFWPFKASGETVAGLGSELQNLNVELQRLLTIPKDPKVEERKVGLSNEIATVTSYYERGVDELLTILETREKAIQRLLGASAIVGEADGAGRNRPGTVAMDDVEWTKQQREIAILESQISQLKNLSGGELETVLPTVFPNPTLDRMLQDMSARSEALREASRNKGPKHPEIEALQAQVAALQEQIRENIKGTLTAKELQLRALKAAVVAARPLASKSSGDVAAQRADLEREIELARQQQEIVKKQVAVGRATTEESIAAEREVLRLQRELASLPDVAKAISSATGEETAAGVEAQIAWFKKLSPWDLQLAIHTQIPTERMKELFRQKAEIEDRAPGLAHSDQAAKEALEDELRQNYERRGTEAHSIVQALELKAQMLRVKENRANRAGGDGTSNPPTNPSVPGPLRITVSGETNRPLLLIYPKDYPRDRIPKDQLSDPNVVVGTISLAEVLARSSLWGPYGVSNAVDVKRFVDGELKSWRLMPDSAEAREFDLHDGDVIYIRRKTIVF